MYKGPAPIDNIRRKTVGTQARKIRNQPLTARDQQLMTQIRQDFEEDPERLPDPHKELSQEEVEKLEWAFQRLADPLPPYGTIKVIGIMANANQYTVRGWRKKLLKDPTWRPNLDHHCRRSCLTQAQELEVRRRIVEQYLDKKKFCPPKVVNDIALSDYRSAFEMWKFH